MRRTKDLVGIVDEDLGLKSQNGVRVRRTEDGESVPERKDDVSVYYDVLNDPQVCVLDRTGRSVPLVTGRW